MGIMSMAYSRFPRSHPLPCCPVRTLPMRSPASNAEVFLTPPLTECPPCDQIPKSHAPSCRDVAGSDSLKVARAFSLAGEVTGPEPFGPLAWARARDEHNINTAAATLIRHSLLSSLV